MQRTLTLALVAAVAFASATMFAVSLQAQTKPSPIPTPVSVSAGRWQVVNGAPGYRGMVMLLDTATGHTWIACRAKDGADGWCRRTRRCSRRSPPSSWIARASQLISGVGRTPSGLYRPQTNRLAGPTARLHG